MANKKITDYDAIDAIAAADLVEVVDDVAGTPVCKKSTFTLIAAFLASLSQTLTNKTLTAPVISTISNTGTLTLPTSTDTLVGKATTDTLTNKTLTDPVIANLLLGSTPRASTGLVRMANAVGAYARNAADGADVCIFNLLSTNNLAIGGDGGTVNTNLASNLTVGTSGSFICRVSGTVKWQVGTSSAASAVALLGNGTAFGGVNGTGTQAMADANQTPAAAVYQCTAIETTGALGADRDLVLPTGTAASAYPKLIINSCTGANIVVKMASGTTVTVAAGKSAWVWVDNTGVRRGSADV